ncbi:MAG: hypothetical protein KDB80_12535, partial [Planctomycetes bacterium]|nr:hypothetical protein [Planctomycetota bacterium]
LAKRAERDGTETRGESPAMIAAVVDAAAEEIAALPATAILDGRRTVRVWAFAGTFALAAGVVLLGDLAVTKVFFARFFGADTAYPRSTYLHVELPEDNPEVRVTLGAGTAEVVMPAGGDLPVLVFAEGSEPREVVLQTSGGRGIPNEVTMAPRGGSRFRHVFRRVQREFTFHARGGDDPLGDRTVSVRVVEPPRVGTITARVTFPEYTGTDPIEIVGGAIEALAGSTVDVFVSATAEVASAQLHMIDSDVRIDLAPRTLRDDSGVSTSYAGTFTIAESDRYQVLFVGATGIRNPHPGTYPIRAVEDHEPIAQLISPSNDDLNVVLPGAILPVRVAATDDFGIAAIEITSTTGKAAQDDGHVQSVPLFVAPEGGAPQAECSVGALLEVASLAPAAPAVGDVIVVGGSVRDIREPEPQIAELAERHVHVVEPTDLGRRISSHFRRIREGVEKALELQESRLSLLDEIRADAVEAARLRDALITIEVGQGRVLAETRRVHRELMRSFDVHLFNRLEESPNAPKVLESYTRYYRENPAAEPLDPVFYRSVAEGRRAGAIGPMTKTLDPILGMIVRTDGLANDLAPSAVDAIERAQIAGTAADRSTELDRASQLQSRIVEDLRELRGQLDEWNEFQDVITQTRAIRDKQKDIRSRTESLQRGDK